MAAPASTALLEIRDLTKVYRGGVRANDGINLSVPRGTVYGMLGHNGAGKTTLVNQVVGLLRPTAGTIRLDGRDAVADPGYARRICSLQAQAQVPINGLTPRQAIELVGRLRGGRLRDVRPRATRLIEALDIGEWERTDGQKLSGGVKRLTSFAMAAIEPGGLVMLDEPTNDVDPVRRRLLWQQVRALAAEGAAVLLVTHNVVEAERSVDRLVILDRGKVVAEGTPASLKEHLTDDLRLELVLEPGASAPAMAPFVTRSVAHGARVLATVPARGAGEAATWAEGLQRAGIVEEFTLAPATLEDVYVELVGRSDALDDGAAAVEPTGSTGGGDGRAA
jgi:ABC-2 type transport system ATP-binding protein